MLRNKEVGGARFAAMHCKEWMGGQTGQILVLRVIKWPLNIAQ